MKDDKSIRVFSENLNKYMHRYKKSAAEIARYCGCSRSTVGDWVHGQSMPYTDNIDRLCDLFHCKRSDLLMTEEDRPSYLTGITGLIKVFDGIPAGSPALIDEGVIDYMPVSMRNPSEYFAVRVHGNSMIDANIQDGTEVIFHSQNYAEDGDIVACRLEGDMVTLKRFRRTNGMVYLMPENPSYAPIIVPASDFENGTAGIIGKAVKVIINIG